MAVKLDETDWKNNWTLDDAAECLPVSDKLYKKLWSLMRETIPLGDEGMEYPEQRTYGLNNLGKMINKFTMAERLELDKAHWEKQ
jgi:hypothetical protein